MKSTPLKLYSFPGPLLQGLFIFLFHVVRHEKVYGKIKSKLPNIKVCMRELESCHVKEYLQYNLMTPDTNLTLNSLDIATIICTRALHGNCIIWSCFVMYMYC